MNILENFTADGSWTLFLDRDGVINKNRNNDYVKTWNEFEFLPGSIEAIQYFSGIFGRICVITNQQGIGKGLMSEKDLGSIHDSMLNMITEKGGRIDKIYHCPELAKDNPECRKPEIGMGLQALKDFPKIDVNKTIMVGDSVKDMDFAMRMGVQRFFVNGRYDKFEGKITYPEITNLTSLASYIKEYLRAG
jgi:histidinol-phosphate phosphatase family protein